MQTLQDIVRALLVGHEGILAADESTQSIGKRFAEIGIASTPELHRQYRQMFFTTPGISAFISGVILYDETIRQSTDTEIPFPEYLLEAQIIPGIKVDLGTEQFIDTQETHTKGLDGLGERLCEYYDLGARFAKWRAVIKIGKGLPSDKAIAQNASELAEYAALCQAAGIVPIIEPEVLMDGTHHIDDCYHATVKTLKAVFAAQKERGVDLTGLILKSNMVIDGADCAKKSSPETIADKTMKAFLEAVPAEVPGIVFLSGGQSEREACENLNAIINHPEAKPWELTYSYGRALQHSAMHAWAGKKENIEKAQAIFKKRAELCSLARDGRYSPEMEP
jgi:fructose-bisphosphate aldolase class I